MEASALLLHLRMGCMLRTVCPFSKKNYPRLKEILRARSFVLAPAIHASSKLVPGSACSITGRDPKPGVVSTGAPETFAPHAPPPLLVNGKVYEPSTPPPTLALGPGPWSDSQVSTEVFLVKCKTLNRTQRTSPEQKYAHV